MVSTWQCLFQFTIIFTCYSVALSPEFISLGGSSFYKAMFEVLLDDSKDFSRPIVDSPSLPAVENLV